MINPTKLADHDLSYQRLCVTRPGKFSSNKLHGVPRVSLVSSGVLPLRRRSIKMEPVAGYVNLGLLVLSHWPHVPQELKVNDDKWYPIA